MQIRIKTFPSLSFMPIRGLIIKFSKYHYLQIAKLNHPPKSLDLAPSNFCKKKNFDFFIFLMFKDTWPEC